MTELMRFLLLLGVAVSLAACSGEQHDDHAEHDHSEHDHSEHDHSEHGHAGSDSETTEDASREVLYWYDPMRPEVHFDEPGPSPFMDMDLVPRYADEVSPGTVSVEPGIQQVMNLRTVAVERGTLSRQIDTVGRIDHDASRLDHLHPRVEGWIESVGVDAVGERVRTGEQLFTLYAPELVNAQEELLSALRGKRQAELDAARGKLRRLGVQTEVIEQLEREGEVRQALPWTARRNGIITQLGIRNGMHVRPGDILLETVDLDQVWVIADVFDRHAEWVTPGQTAIISSPYSPGVEREGRVSYVYPQLALDTRTLRVRIPLDNPQQRLRPGMWVSVVIEVPTARDRVHIPRAALIRSGRMERVVVRADDSTFRVLEVVAGAEYGERVEILRGLEGDEQVVVSGQFLVDSEAALGPGFERLEGGDDAAAEEARP